MNTVKQGVGLDHESRHRLDLVVEEEHVGIDVRAAVVRGGWTPSDRNIRRESAERLSLPEIGLRSAEPTSVAIPDLGAVLQHDSVEEKSCVGPVEGAEYRLVAEHHILPASLHTQVLHPGEVPDQHIASSDAQDAAVPETSRVRAVLAVIGPLIVLDRGTLLPVGAPHGCVLEFHVEIHVR